MNDHRLFQKIPTAIFAVALSMAGEIAAGAPPTGAVPQFQGFKIGSYSAVAQTLFRRGIEKRKFLPATFEPPG